MCVCVFHKASMCHIFGILYSFILYIPLCWIYLTWQRTKKCDIHKGMPVEWRIHCTSLLAPVHPVLWWIASSDCWLWFSVSHPLWPLFTFLSQNRPTLIFTIFNLDRSITAPITPLWWNVSSTFSSLLSTLIPPHKRDQIYSGRRSGICSKEHIQGVFTCWLAMGRLEKRLSLVKWSRGKKNPWGIWWKFGNPRECCCPVFLVVKCVWCNGVSHSLV